MFDNLSDRLSQTFRKLSGKAKLSEDNIQDGLREVRMALLEADVALPVVKSFVDTVRERALGQEVQKSLTPGQAFLKIVNEVLTKLMGDVSVGLDLAAQAPLVILVAGLQGAGKTTTVAKLAHWLKTTKKHSVLLCSVDIYRPAAIQQLKTLADQVGVDFFNESQEDPIQTVIAAKQAAKDQVKDVLIIDTAGRLHIDESMMNEVKQISGAANPHETLFVVDAMTGQDAANTSKAFNDALALTGVILTKLDGDARGGAALSIREVTQKPIKFIGMGEKIDALEVFHPDRIASRILGMGDVLSLIEEAEQKFDQNKAEKLAKKIKRGKKFDLSDFLDQLQQMKKLGGLGGLVDKLPGANQLTTAMQSGEHEKSLKRMEAIIQSMTKKERRFPDLINGSRKKRISNGSGTHIQDLNRLLKQHRQMQKMMTKMTKKGGIANMMRGLNGQIPPSGHF